MRPVPLPFISPVRGVTHYPDSVSRVEAGMPALIVREPGNPYDPHACRVDVAGETVGYLPRDISARLCLRDEPAWSGEVSEVLVGDWGVGLRVQVRSGVSANQKRAHSASGAHAPEPSDASTTLDAHTTAFDAENQPLVRARSGRTLGRLSSREDNRVWVTTPAGQRVSYPEDLVLLDTAG